MKLSGDQRFAGCDDGFGELTVERAEFDVGSGGRFLDKAERTNQIGHRRDHSARYREILDCAGRVYTPIRCVGDVLFAQKILLDAIADRHGDPENNYDVMNSTT